MRPSSRFVLVVALVLGCSSSAPATGSERGPCYANGTCDVPLVCLSSLCVRPGGSDGAIDAAGLDAAVLDAAGRDAAGLDAPGATDAGSDARSLDAGPPERRTYVVSEIFLPEHAGGAVQYGLDLDGDGAKDNALGQILAALSSAAGTANLSFQPSTDLGVGSATAIMLVEALAPSFTAGDISARVLGGQHPIPAACTTPSDFSTCGMHLAGTGHFDVLPPTWPLLSGTVTAAVFDVGAGQSAFPFFPDGVSPVWVPLVGARIRATVSADGLMTGVLGGGIRQSDLNTIFLPAWQSAIAAAITRDCGGGPRCVSNSPGEIYLMLFDADHDGAVTLVELATSSLLSTLLALDVDLLDASGDPGHDGTPDSLSVGIGFTAVGATFSAP